MPAVPPCSSITTAICVRSRRIVASTSSSGAVSGTTGNRPDAPRRHGLADEQQPQQILDVKHADDVIEVALDRPDSACAACGRGARESVRRRADRDPGDADARHHDLAGGQIAELEQLAQHLARLGAQRALLFGFLDDELQLLGRVVLLGVLRLAVDAEQASGRGCRWRSARPRAGSRSVWIHSIGGVIQSDDLLRRPAAPATWAPSRRGRCGSR